MQVGDGNFARYELIRPIGEGTMAEVYEAYDPRTDRMVALKILKRAWRTDDEVVKRFLAEARAAGALSHTNIVRYYDVDIADDAPYITIEFMDGPSLAHFLAEHGRLEVGHALMLLRQLADALDFAHTRGRIHRDIKPSNILLSPDLQTAKIGDFGVARIEHADLTRVTQVGEMLGTPRYMSPEQIAGRTVDWRCDLFALGAVAYEMLTGQKAFNAGSLAALASQITHADPVPISELAAEVPPHVARAVERLLQKDPDTRLQSGAEFVAALDSAPRGRPPTTRTHRKSRPYRRKWVLVVGVGSAGVAAAGLLALFLVPVGSRDDGLQSLPSSAPRVEGLAEDTSSEPATDTAMESGAPQPDPNQGEDTQVSARQEPPELQSAQSLIETLNQQRAEADRRVMTEAPTQEEVTPPAAADLPVQDEAESKGSDAGVEEQVSEDAEGEPPEDEPPPEQDVTLVVPRIEPPSAAGREGPSTRPPWLDGWINLAAYVLELPCARIEAEPARDDLHLHASVIRSQHREAIIERAQGLPGLGGVDVRLGSPSSPFCELLDLLAEQTLPNRTRMVTLQPRRDEYRLRADSFLVLEVHAPAFDSYMQVDYFTADGKVEHMFPKREDYPARVTARSTFTLGNPAQGRWWTIHPPFGTELVVVLASDLPLFKAPRPRQEAASDYVAALARALAAHPSPPRPLSSVLHLETVARSE